MEGATQEDWQVRTPPHCLCALLAMQFSKYARGTPIKVWDIILPVTQLCPSTLILLSASEFQSTHRNNGFSSQVQSDVIRISSDVLALKFSNEACSLQLKEQN